jgi:hypothetical protein
MHGEQIHCEVPRVLHVEFDAHDAAWECEQRQAAGANVRGCVSVYELDVVAGDVIHAGPQQQRSTGREGAGQVYGQELV